jgi:hypothetical protein
MARTPKVAVVKQEVSTPKNSLEVPVADRVSKNRRRNARVVAAQAQNGEKEGELAEPLLEKKERKIRIRVKVAKVALPPTEA